MLAGYTRKDVERITQKFFLENIEKAKEKLDEDLRNRVRTVFSEIFFILRLLFLFIVVIQVMINLSFYYI